MRRFFAAALIVWLVSGFASLALAHGIGGSDAAFVAATNRADPKLWDIYITHSPFLPEPSLMGIMSDSSPGWWATATTARGTGR